MSLQTVLLPLFAQVALTLVLMILMAVRRAAAIRAKQVREADISLREPNWPPRALQAAYAFSNQFEAPVLFYVLTILVVITR
ncbi:MAG: MAPEG family protein, partial [Xanthobacteraceae bacterium]